MFFLSSPTPAPPTQAYPFSPSATKQPRLPRANWTSTNPFTHESSYAQTYSYNTTFYAPHSPSPLRTARNANLMGGSPTPKNGASMLSSSPLRGAFEEDGENWGGDEPGRENTDQVEGDGFQSKTHATPLGKMNMKNSLEGGHGFDGEGSPSWITPPDSGSHSQTRSHLDQEHPKALSSPLTSTSIRPFSTVYTSAHPSTSQWSLRSRASSPSSQLTSHTVRSREERKSLFLDRIRRRRDDERSDVVVDQVLRMDFVKERKGWEDIMARRARVEAGPGQADEDWAGEDGEEVPMGADEEMSPTEEYDDLIREFELQAPGQVQQQQDDEFLVDDNDADDEEYERLFREMEILSQQPQQPPQEHSQNQAENRCREGERLTLQDGQQQQQPPFQLVDSGGNEAMDLS